MALTVRSQPLPLKTDADGAVRVGGTRVTLDTVVAAFDAGCTPEEIVLNNDVLRLEDVYLVLGYYLRHRREVDPYLAARGREADSNRERAEIGLPWRDVRARLLARQEGSADTPPPGR